MGTDKCFVLLDGRPLVRRVADALDDAGATTLRCIGGDHDRLRSLGLAAEPDRHPGEGPLGAVIQALDSSADDLTAILAVDLVAPDATTIRATVAIARDDPADVTVPLSGGRLQVLHGVWRRSAVASLRRSFDAGNRSLTTAIGDLDVRRVLDQPPAGFVDADTPDQLRYPGRMIPEIQVDEAERRIEAGAALLDVRQPDEYAAGRVPGGQLIPLHELPGRLADVPVAEEVLVICRSGARSARAVEWLIEHGVPAVNIAGGTNAWAASGRPVASGPGTD
jgi:rhodanese-related sulfurtransferase/molybdopterin-guanine dinucleotide biosynthesis protein A